MPFGSGRIHADPKTPSQLRAALAAAQSQSDTLGDAISAVAADVAALETVVDDLQAQVGPIVATFDATAVVGQPVYVTGVNTVDLADADSRATARVAGLVFTAASAGNEGAYLAAGRITQANWTGVTGTVSLMPGSLYCLSGTAGQLTTTPPSAAGQVVVQCGVALNTETLLLAIEPGVLL